jgi:hypothetical protein
MVVCCPAVTDEGFFYLPHDKPASAPLPCLPAGWSKAVSKGTGATYFLHTGGASQFEMPSEPAEEPASESVAESVVELDSTLDAQHAKLQATHSALERSHSALLREQWELAHAGGAAVSELSQQKKRFEEQQADQEVLFDCNTRCLFQFATWSPS